MLYNGYGTHNIQGIGDKHIPLIHNVTNTDVVTAVSDRSTDALDLLFNTAEGRRHLIERVGVPAGLVASLGDLGLSSICNILAAIKVAKLRGMGPGDVLLTVATDGAALYADERDARLARTWPDGLDPASAAGIFGEHVLGVACDHLLELTGTDRDRIFNLGYYTWVEQQGVPLADFEARRDQSFWRTLRELLSAWDAMIVDFNGRTGVLSGA
jgi:hypothetical protein